MRPLGQVGNNKELLGIVFNIQRYCIHDGPGIRTTVFLKGCPLNCPWCSNPESIHPDSEIVYDKNHCIHCETCIHLCPMRALKFIDGELKFERDICNQCNICVQNCMSGGLQLIGNSLTADDVIQQVNKDLSFYKRSGGGVTFSGGEPVFQYHFLLSLLKKFKAEKIHTTIETGGFQKWEILSKIVEEVDLVYYDLKIIDDKKHKRIMGVSNSLILSNAKMMIKNYSAKVIFRIPIIPTYTDSEDNIKGITNFLKGIGYKGGIEIIPYHRFGESKYHLLNKSYKLKGISPPITDQLQKIKDMIEEEGFSVRINN